MVRYIQSPLTRARETADIILHELNNSVESSRMRGFQPLSPETNPNI